MKKIKILAVAMWVFILLGIASAAANDARGRGQMVVVGRAQAQSQQIVVADVDADVAFDTIWSNQADLVRFKLPPRPQPRSACDDAEDCARAIKDTCAIVDPTGPSSGVTVSYKGQEGTCEGTCNDGQSVTVVCVSKR